MATKKRDVLEETPVLEESVPVALPEPVNVAALEVAAARAEHAGEKPDVGIPVTSFVMSKFGAKNFDQYGGFVRWASKQKIARLTREQWEQKLSQFQNRIIGG